MRLFIAIRLDDNIKDALTTVQKTLRASRVGGYPVRPQAVFAARHAAAQGVF